MLLLAPALIVLAGITLYPLFYGIWLSLCEKFVGSPARFVGLANFEYLISWPQFGSALVNTFIFTIVAVSLKFVLGMSVALALNQHLPGMRIFRTLFFIPVVSSTVAVALVWKWFYNVDFGVLNWVLGFFGMMPGLLPYLMMFLAISLVSAVIYVLLESYQASFQRNLEYRERYSLTESVIYSQWEALRNLNHGDFINAVTHEAELYKTVIKNCFICVSEFTQILFFISFAIVVSTKIVMLSIALFSASAFIFYPLMKKGTSLGKAWTNAYSGLTDGLVNTVRSFKSAKASSQERFVMKYLSPRVFSVGQEYFRQQVLTAIQSKLSELTGYVVLAIIIYSGIKVMRIPLTDVVLILVIFVRLVPKTKLIIDSFHRAYSGLPSLEKIQAIKSASLPRRTAGKSIDSELGTISLHSVGFRYHDDAPLFRNLTITLRKGEFWVICGPTGAGKTTVLDLLAGLVTPSEGMIYYNGISLNEIDMESMHRKVGYIMQDHFIFAGTILENIFWGNEIVDRSRLPGVMKIAQLEEMLREKGYDFQVSESGQNLSGGQRQRIAIARVLMNDLDFILMDEPTSSLDQGTEQSFISALLEFKGKIGIVMVTHRQHNIGYFDHILMLDGNSAYEVRQESESLAHG